MAVVKFTNSKKSLGGVLRYVMNEEKTEARLISGQNCMPESAAEEMTVIKNMYGKNHGRQYIHIVQSFAPEDALDHKTAHEISRRLAARFAGYQAVIVTHRDKNHIHNHVVLNAVNMETGLKFQQSREDLRRVKEFSNQLCAKYGLRTIRIGKTGQSKQYAEWRAEKQGISTWRGLLRADIDEVISYCSSPTRFMAAMQAKGYEVKQGQDYSFRARCAERFIRLRSLGAGYSWGEIIQRMRSMDKLGHHLPGMKKPDKIYRFRTGMLTGYPFRPIRMRGLRALYFRYLYMLGKLRKGTAPKAVTRCVSRESLIRFRQYQEQFALLVEKKIETAEQLASSRSFMVQRVDALVGRRAELNREKKQADDPTVFIEQIADINAALRRLRRDLRTIDRIETEADMVRQEVEKVKQMSLEMKSRKVQGRYERSRGRSREWRGR